MSSKTGISAYCAAYQLLESGLTGNEAKKALKEIPTACEGYYYAEDVSTYIKNVVKG